MENKLTPEQIEKLKACRSVAEMIAFAKEKRQSPVVLLEYTDN